MKRTVSAALLVVLLFTAALASVSCEEQLDPIISTSGTAQIEDEDEYIEFDETVPDDLVGDGMSGMFRYRIYGRHAEITKYIGNDTDVKIPAGIDKKKVTVICEGAFQDRASLQSVTVPDTVETIESKAFMRCYNLETVNGGAGVTSVGDRAFAQNVRLKSIALSPKLESIGNFAFMWCSSLEEITIPASCDTIGERAFACCTGAKSLIFEDGQTVSIGNEAFMSLHSLTSLCYPFAESAIGDGVFKQAENLTDITFDPRVREIASRAFQNSGSLTRIVIPDHVSKIGELAFGTCKSVTDCTFESSVIYIGDLVFHQVPDVTIHGKKDSTAEFYAKIKGIRFEATESRP